IFGMIHPQLQDKDYQALNPGDPIFLTFDDQTIVYQGTSTVWPIFINEAAYYEKGIAMCLTQRQQINI
ncbi:MAG: succinylglutamate desuccinylase/aspartoacylase domain-containing protein, partial [Nostoc sp.]